MSMIYIETTARLYGDKIESGSMEDLKWVAGQILGIDDDHLFLKIIEQLYISNYSSYLYLVRQFREITRRRDALYL